MELLLSPNNGWSCLPSAFAMVTDSLPKDIIEYCGHDGSEVLWPELPEPMCRRAFSLEEMLDYCLSQCYCPVTIQRHTAYSPLEADTAFNPYDDEMSRIKHYLLNRPAVLLGINSLGNRHAVAWDHVEQKIFDPKGYKSSLDEFDVHSVVLMF